MRTDWTCPIRPTTQTTQGPSRLTCTGRAKTAQGITALHHLPATHNPSGRGFESTSKRKASSGRADSCPWTLSELLVAASPLLKYDCCGPPMREKHRAETRKRGAARPIEGRWTMSTAFALAGLGGNNAHGAGFLAAAQELQRRRQESFAPDALVRLCRLDDVGARRRMDRGILPELEFVSCTGSDCIGPRVPGGKGRPRGDRGCHRCARAGDLASSQCLYRPVAVDSGDLVHRCAGRVRSVGRGVLGPPDAAGDRLLRPHQSVLRRRPDHLR